MSSIERLNSIGLIEVVTVSMPQMWMWTGILTEGKFAAHWGYWVSLKYTSILKVEFIPCVVGTEMILFNWLIAIPGAWVSSSLVDND